MKPKYLSIFMSVLLISGCQSSFGPSALSNTHVPYNEAISETLNQQMLLNLVRLKYHDEAFYLKVNNVTSSLQFGGNLGIGGKVNLIPKPPFPSPNPNFNTNPSVSPSSGANYSDRPTISYLPLEGEDFYKSMFTTVPLDKLFNLIATGWSIDNILGLCVDEINGIGNAAQASGVTPKVAPKYQNFERLLVLLKSLQDEGLIKIGASGKTPGTQVIKFIETPENRQTIEEVMAIFGLPKNTRLVKITDAEFFDVEKPVNDPTLAIYARSISGMLFYLSHNIQIPAEHIEKGLVRVTKTAEGQNFNWSRTPGGKLLSIKSSSSYPSDAYIAIPYNGYWFYIADNDLQSKSTFMLVMQLFDYQSGQGKADGPKLTLPVK